MPLQGRSRRDVLVEFRNAEILDAARRVFAHKGYRDASVDAIAEAAEVSKGTVYSYYKSKQEIYWAALNTDLDRLAETLESEVQAASGLEAQVRAFIQTKLAYFEEHRDFFRIYYAEFGNCLAEEAHADESFKERHLRQVALLEAALVKHEAQLQGLRPASAAFAIANLTRGVITQRLLGWSATTLEEDIAFLVGFTTRGLLGQ